KNFNKIQSYTLYEKGLKKMRKKYLVTGGAGFIGSNLIEKIISQGDEVVVGRHLPSECKEDDNNLKDNITFYQADVTNYEFME
ncbi:NAD-dependent epimerase/dehydratase family protein, partial [Ligilactobacillus salivarius]|uniref:NAD-dependent epimerase/dehydratase family protein n=1 Tax=Ligilactobacillus salivarius TaxID=1624 RepID=UPI001CDAF3C4